MSESKQLSDVDRFFPLINDGKPEPQYPPLFDVVPYRKGILREATHIAIDIEKTGEMTYHAITHVGIALSDKWGIFKRWIYRLPFNFPPREDLVEEKVDDRVWGKRCVREFWSKKDKVPDATYHELSTIPMLPGQYQQAMKWVCQFVANLLDSSGIKLVFVGDNLVFDVGGLNFFYEHFIGLPLPYSKTHGYHLYLEVNSFLKAIPKCIWEPMVEDVARTESAQQGFTIANTHLPDADACNMLIKFNVAQDLRNALMFSLNFEMQQKGPFYCYLDAMIGEGLMEHIQGKAQEELRNSTKRKWEEEFGIHNSNGKAHPSALRITRLTIMDEADKVERMEIAKFSSTGYPRVPRGAVSSSSASDQPDAPLADEQMKREDEPEDGFVRATDTEKLVAEASVLTKQVEPRDEISEQLD